MNRNLAEVASYWLLYVVSYSGALLHWRLGNLLLAAGCAAASVFSVHLILRAHGGLRKNLSVGR